MNRRLVIGIVEPGLGWTIVLRQCGVAYERVSGAGTIDADRYSVVIVNRAIGGAMRERLTGYLRGGGAVLDTGNHLGSLPAREIRRSQVRSLLPSDQEATRTGIMLLDLHAPVRRHRGSDLFGGLLSFREVQGGYIGWLGLDIDGLTVDTRSARRQFHTPTGRYPSEVVSVVSKGEVRRLVEHALMELHALRGLPYLHIWFFPDERPNIFCFRIDTDYGTRAQILDLYRTARRCGVAMSWFLHVEAHEEWLDLFTRFEEQEIAVHCRTHRTYPTYEPNAANMAEATYLLRRAGLDPVGFAAPNGRWNRALGRAVRDQGFLYSSEFALAYDDLPFNPALEGAFSPALQVPIHPVSVGNFLRVRGTEREMVEYYGRAVEEKLAYDRPLIFYHHPTHEAGGLLDEIFGAVRNAGVESVTFADYARWWNLRSRAYHAAEWSGERLDLELDADPSVALRIVLPDGRRGFVRGGTILLSDIQWSVPPPGLRRPDDYMRIRRTGLKTIVHSIEDINTRMRQ